MMRQHQALIPELQVFQYVSIGIKFSEAAGGGGRP